MRLLNSIIQQNTQNLLTYFVFLLSNTQLHFQARNTSMKKHTYEPLFVTQVKK